ncbi:right-handed parallel beta-helix repeat-containing protein [Methylobacter tundripaludum]|uniref:Right handed beta helix domain-containing protein n=1 Tax=Methylobacter tundripaludum (strain ATCC BAA-1195 / DSM 17260 / SV96) TaxID=697282 RepID=G3IZ64_METTV|nr:right-handed parallel beta-helix repeat-containing protein [Methylobacter tundripaludum]EGW20236.1 hypothetical protein Mettu_3366 [Methylobacter tundripaludum SV96]
MKTKYENTVFHFLATFGCLMLLVPFAHADTQTPLDCPGVIVVQGGYSLTEDTTCDTGFRWHENNKFFSLNGFTLTTGSILVEGDRLTIRNGALQTNGINWAFGDHGTLLNLAITSAGAPRGFFIEAGSNFTVKNSTLTNIPHVALSFYYGDGGTVRNSKFTGNGWAISIQKSNGVLIEHNNFVGNIRGSNLWDEDGGGVNNNKIRHNIFRENRVGINMLALPQSTSIFPAFEGNQIIGNQISRSSHSGALIEVVCDDSSVPLRCPAQNTNVSGNRLNRNGFNSLTGLPDGAEPDDDGVTARATLRVFGNQSIPYPDGLAGVVLSNNRADRNADLGFDVQGVTDGGGNIAESNENPEQCVGLICSISVGEPLTVRPDSISARSLSVLQDAISKAPSASGQLRHRH